MTEQTMLNDAHMNTNSTRKRSCSMGGRSSKRWTPLSIGAVVLGFIVWAPLGLLALGYIFWGGSIDKQIKETIDRFRTPRSGNAAFDEYKRETLQRLEDEQQAFDEFVENLRRTRDQETFDRFMKERKK